MWDGDEWRCRAAYVAMNGGAGRRRLRTELLGEEQGEPTTMAPPSSMEARTGEEEVSAVRGIDGGQRCPASRGRFARVASFDSGGDGETTERQAVR